MMKVFSTSVELHYFNCELRALQAMKAQGGHPHIINVLSMNIIEVSGEKSESPKKI